MCLCRPYMAVSFPGCYMFVTCSTKIGQNFVLCEEDPSKKLVTGPYCSKDNLVTMVLDICLVFRQEVVRF